MGLFGGYDVASQRSKHRHAQNGQVMKFHTGGQRWRFATKAPTPWGVPEGMGSWFDDSLINKAPHRRRCGCSKGSEIRSFSQEIELGSLWNVGVMGQGQAFNEAMTLTYCGCPNTTHFRRLQLLFEA